MGNHPRAAKVPDHGAVSSAFDPPAAHTCPCAQPADAAMSTEAALDAPRLFALVVAEVEVPEEVYEQALAILDGDPDAADRAAVDPAGDPDEAAAGDESPAGDEPLAEGDGQPGDVVAWGLSFSQRAVVFLHNPLTGRDDVGIFDSPQHARAFYSLFGDLDLTYV